MRREIELRKIFGPSSLPVPYPNSFEPEPTIHGGLCTWVANLDFAFGFCGVPSTRTIGPFGGGGGGCVRVVELLADAAVSASTFAGGGGAFGPSLRRFLKTFDMLTSRCKTLRGLDSVRRIPAASCSSETERERERDCPALRLALLV